jgi:hypothetical protein
MSILPQLERNKGTVSSALGKSLAAEVLAGDVQILEEAVSLLAHQDKNVRAGAAKIVEQVAVGKPELVVGFLPQLVPALDVPEPQTRWMVIHTMGLCSALNPGEAMEAMPKAQEYLEQESGACLWGATIKYLGYVGATSEENARRVLPLLEQALEKLPKQAKTVLEGFMRMLDHVDDESRNRVGRYAESYAQDERPSVRAMARRLGKRV